MAKFRETLWFKKGQLDAEQAAGAAADGSAEADEREAPAVDSPPPADRYHDDGTVSTRDSEVFGVHTGGTGLLQTLDDATGETEGMEVREVVGEMKRSRVLYVAVLAAGLVLLGTVVVINAI